MEFENIKNRLNNIKNENKILIKNIEKHKEYKFIKNVKKDLNNLEKDFIEKLDYMKNDLKLLNQKILNYKISETDELYRNKLILVKTDWCPHSNRFKHTWRKLSKEIKDLDIDFEIYDGDYDEECIEKYNITGYPTLILETKDKFIEYCDKMELENIIDFIKKN